MNSYMFGVSTAPLFIIGLVFLILKLTGFIGWSWWLVLLPFYFPALIIVSLLAWVILAFYYDEIVDYAKRKFKNKT